MENEIIVCKRCACNLRLPLNKGILVVTCPKCKYEFQFDSGPKPINTDRETDYTNSTYKAKELTSRKVMICRLTHLYKDWNVRGIGNMLKDNTPVHIFVDDKDQGALPKDDLMIVSLNYDSHILKCTTFGTKYVIPAGNEHYEAYYFNKALQIGPVQDQFRDELIMFVLKMFRGKGIRERMMDLNNRNHNVKISVEHDGIRLSWDLVKPQGIKQWISGMHEEKISYRQMGITPLMCEKQPSGYWNYIQTKVEDAIVMDEEADMEKYLLGIRMRTEHRLY